MNAYKMARLNLWDYLCDRTYTLEELSKRVNLKDKDGKDRVFSPNQAKRWLNDEQKWGLNQGNINGYSLRVGNIIKEGIAGKINDDGSLYISTEDMKKLGSGGQNFSVRIKSANVGSNDVVIYTIYEGLEYWEFEEMKEEQKNYLRIKV
ncbi:MAG: hypothetical protein GQ559_09675, partial [Desulfobulbaceae bacterium]|nr:hypothetical protein [Desulfobulbaceae bacterium]